MRALITGGAGFIGSHLAEALLAAGHEVDVIDNLSTGSIRNIGHLKAHPKFKYSIDTLTNEPLQVVHQGPRLIPLQGHIDGLEREGAVRDDRPYEPVSIKSVDISRKK